QRLVLARARCGEKPLYYARLSRTLLFASEPKALLMHPRVSRELDGTALARYLTYDYVPAPHAIFRAVRKLPPAHWMAVGVGGAEIGARYWTPPAPGTIRPTRRQAGEGVLDLLRQSVRRRLVSDVPWGTFLSGGLDSSRVTALAVAEARRPVKTFAIGFAQSTYDEWAAAAAAERLPTSHRYLSVDFALRRFLREVRRPALERHLRWMGSFAPETLGSLLVPQVQREVLDPEPYVEAYDAIAPLRPRSARE